VQEAVDFSDESPEPPLEELTRHTYRDEDVANLNSVGAAGGIY
jgi:hypothetical protein